jgi:gamma-glutamyltranspeptidase
VGFLQAAGSAMTLDDFASHEVQVTEPLVAEALGATWHVAPPPTQGVTLLAMLAEAPLTLARARAANAARDRHLGDPHAGPVDIEALCAPTVPVAAPSVPASGDTIAIAAVDEEGRAVTLIQSLYQHFGAGLLDPETGVTLHNRGGGFTLEEGHPGVLAPGARPPHTLCPSMVFAGDAIVAAGCQGGRAQPQILAQVAPDVADPHSDLQAAVARPRWIVGGGDLGGANEIVLAEPGAQAPEVEAAAAGVAFERLSEPTGMAGHVQIARLGRDGVSAGSDPRADGGVLLT